MDLYYLLGKGLPPWDGWDMASFRFVVGVQLIKRCNEMFVLEKAS